MKGWKELIHKPLRGNYWHFEWHFFEEDGTPIPNRYKKFTQLIATNEAETWLKEKAKVYKNEDYELPANIYLKEESSTNTLY